MNQGVFTAAGAWLRERRKALDLTQEALAERVGCSAQTVRKIEAGRQRPSHQLAALLVTQLEVPPQERAEIMRRLRAARPPAPPLDGGITAPLTPDMGAPPAARIPALPIPLTALIGRETEIRKVREMLLTYGARLVTLVGPPGIGKTRLALAVAQSLRDEFADGVCFVELAPLTDPDLVFSTIAGALGLARASGSLPERVRHHLRDKQLLLVLDNFEHLPAAAAAISRLLKDTAGLKILATSRVPLRIYGEKEFPVPGLRLPERQTEAAPEEYLQYEAVRLFVERARDIEPDFQLTAGAAAAVAALCAHLDGVPLAIELAAARSRVFSPQALVAQLGDSLQLLRGGAADLPERQQTLHGAISWSYDLLSAAEQQLFRYLGVFEGGATLDAIAAIGGPRQEGSNAIVEIVDSLVSKSLLRRGSGPTQPRFWLLETIKEYARQKLAESGEGEQVRLRHARFYLKAGAVDAWWLPGADYLAWLARLDADQANIRAALAWSLAAESSEQAQGLSQAWHAGGDLGWYWFQRCRPLEARHWLKALLAREARLAAPAAAPAATQQHSKAGLLLAQGATVRWHSPEARQLWEASLALYRELGDRRNSAFLLSYLAGLVLARGDLAEARRLLDEYLAINRESGDTAGISYALGLLSTAAYLQGDPEKARALTQEALATAQRLDSWFARAGVVNAIASQLSVAREFAAAEPLWEEYRQISQQNNYSDGVANALCGLGLAAYGQGNYATARDLYLRGLAGQTVDVIGAYYIVQLGGVELQMALLAQQVQATAQNQPSTNGTANMNQAMAQAAARAVVLVGAGDELLRGELDLLESAIYAFVAATGRQLLGGPDFAAALAQGRALTEGQAYAYAAAPLGRQSTPDQGTRPPDPTLNTGVPPAYLIARAGSTVPPPASGPDYAGLTRREREVAALIAQSKSNGEIAAALVVSKRTVETHITNILAKLDFTSRGQIAAWAIARKLDPSG